MKQLNQYHNFPESKQCFFCNGENDIEDVGFLVEYLDGSTEKVCSVCLSEYSLSYNAKEIKQITNLMLES